MVKISDFFRKNGDAPEDEPKGRPQKVPGQKIPIKEIQKENAPFANATQDFAAKGASETLLKKMKVLPKDETEKLYTGSLDLIKITLDKALNNEAVEVQKIKEQIELLLDQLQLNNTELVSLTHNFSPENYLYCHSVNVCILSLMLGKGAGYSKGQLEELGLASFLHDIGMVRLTEIAAKPNRLSEEEYNQIKEHALWGAEMLQAIVDIPQAAIDVACQHHERKDGSGYPKGLKGEGINEYAVIVSIADIYEAMTHPRAYRGRFIPYEVMREILKNKKHFADKYLKILIERIGVFPIGSLVQLSTEEIGLVVDINKDFPLKPTVKIILDQQQKKVAEEAVINLTLHPALYIRKPVSSDELAQNKP